MKKKTIKKRIKNRKYLIPAIASALLVGFAQILKGDGKKGLKIMLWFYFGFPLAIIISMAINSYLFLIVSALIIIIYPIIWSFNIFDAFTGQIR